jgi:hypothetical protein
MKALGKIFDDFFEKIIDEHIQSDNKDDNNNKDFVDVMLSFVGTQESEYRIERPNIKAIMLVNHIIELNFHHALLIINIFLQRLHACMIFITRLDVTLLTLHVYFHRIC